MSVTLQDSIHTISVALGEDLKKFISDVFRKHAARRGYRWRQNVKKKIQKAKDEVNEKYCDLEDRYIDQVTALEAQIKMKTNDVNTLSDELMKMKDEVEFYRVEHVKEQNNIEQKITMLEEKLNMDNPLGRGIHQQIENIKSKIVVLENNSDSLLEKVNHQSNSMTTTTTVTTKTQPTTDSSPHITSKFYQEKQRSNLKKRKRFKKLSK